MPRPPPRMGKGLLAVLLLRARPNGERPPARPKGDGPGVEAEREGGGAMDRMMNAMKTMMIQIHGPEERLMLSGEGEEQEATREVGRGS